MAAILTLRRGYNNETGSIVFSESELYYNKSKQSLQISNNSGSLITLSKLNAINTGSLHLSGDITASNLYLTGSAKIDGNITLGGTIILGVPGDGNDPDTIIINSTLTGSLIPNTDNRDDLGAPSERFRKLYVATASIDTLNGFGVTSFIESTNEFTASEESKNITLGDWTGSVDLDIIELYSTSSAHELRLDTIESFTGSYATTGSNVFYGTEEITGSLSVSGSVSFNSIPWPTVGSETHILKTDPYILNLESGSRTYGYAGLALEHFEASPGYYHNSVLLYSYDDHDNASYGTELNIGPLRNHMRVYPSSSIGFDATHMANISIEDLQDGTTNALIYADFVELGVYNSEYITIGNSTSINSISGYNTLINTPITSSNTIQAIQFHGDGSNLTNVSASSVTFEDITGKPTLVSESIQIDHNDTTNFVANEHINHNEVSMSAGLGLSGGGTIMESRTLTLDTGSTHFNDGIKQKLDLDGLVSQSLLNDLTNDEVNQLKNIDTSTISTTQWGYVGDLNQSLTNTSDVTFNDITASNNVLIAGNLTVLGTATEIQTSDLYITDKVITIASGSQDGAQADGAGIEIDGTNASMLWEDSTDSFVFNQKVSSSIGFKGDGSEITNIQHTNVDFGGSLIVSGASQVTESLDLRYLEINGDSVVSGSSQIDLTNTTNYISGIKDRLNAELVISSSLQITNGSGLLSSSVDTYNGFSSSIDSRIISLNDFSSSEEGKNSTLASYTGSNDLNITELFATASQYESFSSSIDTTIKTKLNVEGVISSSLDTTTIDINITNGVISANAIGGVVSGSSQLTQSLDTRYEVSGSVSNLIGIRTTSGSLGSAAWYNVSSSIADGNPAVLGSAGAVKSYIDEQLLVIGAGDITSVNASGLYTADYLGLEHTGDGHLNGGYGDSGDVVIAIATGSVKFTQGVLKLIPSGLLSSSNQTFNDFSTSVDVRIDSLESFSSSLDLNFVTQLELASATSSLEISIATKLATSSFETYTGSIDSKFTTLGTYTGSIDNSINLLNAVSHSHSNKTQLDTINQNLSTTSDVTFGSFHTTGTGSIGTNLIIYGNLTVFGTESIINSENLAVSDNMIYLNNGSEITNPDLGVVGNYNDGTYAHSGIFSDASDSQTWKVFKGYTPEPSGSIDTSHASFALADFKAANITATSFSGTINATNGVLSGSLQSQLPSGVVSGSSQVNADSITNFDSNVLAYNNSLGVVSGSTQITKTLQDVTTAGATTSTAITITNTSTSINKTTGALVVTGGVGIGETLNVGGDVVAYASSDIRLKDNIQPIENPLQKINQIGGYSFEWNAEKQNIYSGKDYGVIAQEIEKILPELVDTRENGYKAVKYDKLVSLLIEGIKDLSKEVEQLKKQVNKG